MLYYRLNHCFPLSSWYLSHRYIHIGVTRICLVGLVYPPISKPSVQNLPKVSSLLCSVAVDQAVPRAQCHGNRLQVTGETPLRGTHVATTQMAFVGPSHYLPTRANEDRWPRRY